MASECTIKNWRQECYSDLLIMHGMKTDLNCMYHTGLPEYLEQVVEKESAAHETGGGHGKDKYPKSVDTTAMDPGSFPRTPG
jgi:hypothetical protein